MPDNGKEAIVKGRRQKGSIAGWMRLLDLRSITYEAKQK